MDRLPDFDDSFSINQDELSNSIINMEYANESTIYFNDLDNNLDSDSQMDTDVLQLDLDYISRIDSPYSNTGVQDLAEQSLEVQSSYMTNYETEISSISNDTSTYNTTVSLDLGGVNESRPNFNITDEEIRDLPLFTSPSFTIEELRKERKEFMNKYSHRRHFGYKNKISREESRDFHFSVPAKPIDRCVFSFALDKFTQNFIEKNTLKRKKKFYLTKFEQYWKNRIQDNNCYSCMNFKKCIDIVIIKEETYILVQLKNNSIVPILWVQFPFAYYDKIFKIKNRALENYQSRRKRQNKEYMSNPEIYSNDGESNENSE
uniref:NTR domain-containing protein n=1 Tax=Parastrongyloides trichosuri TaxID=131310 RepID=A0A0N4ZV50_PARTI